MARTPSGIHLLMLLSLVGVALAGCVGGDPGRSDEGGVDPGPAARDPRVILTYNLTAAPCTVTELHLPGSADEARRFLPSGFRPAPSGAAFVVATHTCPGDAADAAPLRASELFVRVEPPVVEERVHRHAREATAWTNGGTTCDPGVDQRYYVAGYSDARFWVERYRQAGISTLEAEVVQSTTPIDSLGLRAATAEGHAAHDGDEVFSFRAATGDRGGLHECVMTWFQSDHGLLVLDEVRRGAAHGTKLASVVTCSVAPGTPFAWAVDAARCAQASAVIAPAVERTGYAYWFHEAFVVPESGV